MKTQGEIEGDIAECMGRFEQEYMGRGPRDVRAHLIGDLIVVRLNGVLTTAERHLANTLPDDKSRKLLKQVRSHLMEIARPALDAMIKGITGMGVVCMHHDICTSSGKEVVVFTLAALPDFREVKNNHPGERRRQIRSRRTSQFDLASADPAPLSTR